MLQGRTDGGRKEGMEEERQVGRPIIYNYYAHSLVCLRSLSLPCYLTLERGERNWLYRLLFPDFSNQAKPSPV